LFVDSGEGAKGEHVVWRERMRMKERDKEMQIYN